MDAKKLVDQLEKIPLGRMYQASQRGLVRLHLYSTGWIHEMILDYEKQARAIILKYSDADGKLDGAHGFLAQRELIRQWSEAFAGYSTEIMKWREQAAMLPFGVMAIFHQKLLVLAPLPSASPQIAESTRFGGKDLMEAIIDGVFSPQLKILLQAAGAHIYGDGMDLSSRIWRIDREARDGINHVLMKGIANGDSAWNIAKELEQYLGANEDCPRWTSTRLYAQSKKDIANGSTAGLVRGDQCDGQGVAYNALRLARTEIQKAHALATDRVMVMQPWVEKEQIHLSAGHAGSDQCDSVISNGEDGKGIYDVGTIELPLHPNCLCYKTAVLMDQKEFTTKLHDWLKDSAAWPEMNQYSQDIGVDPSTSLLNDQSVLSLAVWMFGDALKEWLQ